jgi:hypothetical protein
MNGTDTELRKELWMWRGIIILAITLFTVVSIFSYLANRDAVEYDRVERNKAWSTIQINQTRIMSKLDKHYDATILVDEHLRQCSNCHSHSNVWKKVPK